MFSYYESAKRSAFAAAIFFATLVGLSSTYAALTSWLASGDRTNSGSTLSSASWNRIVDAVLELDTRTAQLSTSGTNVGIGNPSPTNKLSIGSNLGAGYVISANSSTPYGSVIQTTEAVASSNAAFWVRTNNGSVTTPVLRVQNNGSVGINTNSPSAALDVLGNINVKPMAFNADNSSWKSLEYNLVQGNAAGAAIVICSTNTDASSGKYALYLVQAYHSVAPGTIGQAYIGGNLNMFTFRSNSGILEVRWWDNTTGLNTNAQCGVISLGK